MRIRLWAVLLVVLTAAAASFRAGQQTPPATPLTWQPFSADFRVVADGRVVALGKYWRTGDGSDRRERYAVETPGTLSAAQIRRVPDSLCYRFNQTVGWTVQPMLLPEDGWLPPSYPSTGDAAHVRIEQLAAERLSKANGNYIVRVPALNFFRLIRFTAASGRREEYFNVVPGEPDSRLFAPPPDAALKRLREPAGIIDHRRLAALSHLAAGTDDTR